MPEGTPKLYLANVSVPYKIPIVALIAAYCSGILPRRSDTPLLSFIVQIIDFNPYSSKSSLPVEIPLLDLVDKIRDSLMTNIGCNVSAKDMLEDFEVIRSRLLNSIWAIRSLDGFTDFILKIKSLIVPNESVGKSILQQLPKDLFPKRFLTQRSFLGGFLLSLVRDFETMEFDETQLFWNAFLVYREPSLPLFNAINKSIGIHIPKKSNTLVFDNDDIGVFENNSFKLNDGNLRKLIAKIKAELFDDEKGLDNVRLISRVDINRAVTKQICLSQNFGQKTPEDLKNIIRLMGNQGHSLPSGSYYLKYLECFQDNDYQGSFKYLHAYFDYVMSDNQQSFYQYALLGIATLHTKFNSNQQALETIKEAILVARENNDTNCLNYLVSWIFNFLKDKPELKHDFFESNEQLLEFLKKIDLDDANNSESISEFKSKAYEMEAVQCITDSKSLHITLESIIKAEYLSLNEDYNVSSFLTCAHLYTAIWARSGVYELSEMYASMALKNSIREQHSNHIFTSLIRKAFIDYENNDIDGALNRLEQIKAKENQRLVNTYSNMFSAKKCINVGEYYEAKRLLQGLMGLKEVSDLDQKYEIIRLNILNEHKLGNSAKAIQYINEELQIFEKEHRSNNYWYIKFSILYCSVFYDMDHTHPNLLHSIYKVIDLCQHSNVKVLVNDVILLLVKLLIKLNKNATAKKLMDRYMPQIVQYGDHDTNLLIDELIEENGMY